MKGFIIGLFALTVGAIAQPIPVVPLCEKFIAPWGANRVEVMKAASNAKLIFDSMSEDTANGNLHLMYKRNEKERILIHFTYGELVGYSAFWKNYDSEARNRWKSAQFEKLLLSAVDIGSESTVVVECGEARDQYTVRETGNEVWIQRINMETLQSVLRKHVER
jgi:hypothetical protein